MNSRSNFIIVTVIALANLTCTAAVAQQQAEALDRSLLGLWVVEGPDWIRVLKVKSVAKGTDGIYIVDASYANAAAKVAVESGSDKPKLQVTTSAGSVMVLDSSAPATYAGTFTNKSGTAPITMTKVAVSPSSSGLAACASIEGVWEGKWSIGNFGVQTLWIRDVSAECTASVAYGRVRQKISIANGKFSFLCNPSTNGTCFFSPEGSDLRASYTNPQGGRNDSVFRKAE